MPGFSPVLKPENSIVAGLAVVGLVYADYSLHLGNMVQLQKTGANDGDAEASRKKAGWSALVLVSGIALLTRDPNIFVLGSAAIIAMEASARHAIMTDSDTGSIQLPGPSAYAPAQDTSGQVYAGS